MVKVVSTNNAEHYQWGGDCDGWRLLDTQGLSIIEERVLPGLCFRSRWRYWY